MLSVLSPRLAIGVTTVCLVAGCSSAPPPRLGPGLAAQVRSTEVQSVIRRATLTVAAVEARPPTVGLIGAAIRQGMQSVATGRLSGLNQLTNDIDFPAEYGNELALAVKNVVWLHAVNVLHSSDDIPPGHDGTSKTQSVLRVETRQELSPDSAVLTIRSIVEFFVSAEAETPSARVATIYRSEAIGDVAGGDAVEMWADQGGRSYRAALTEAIRESVKLARWALESMAHSPRGGGPPEEIWTCLTWGRPGFGRKMNAVKLVGAVVEETDKRLALQGAGVFYSLPKSAIELRGVAGK
jgi:hypothetical protein